MIIQNTLKIRDQGALCESSLIDISLKSLLVDKPKGFLPGEDEEYMISIPFDKVRNTCIEMTARLAHEEETQIGFHWKEIDHESFQHHRRLLIYNLGDEEELIWNYRGF